MFKIIQQFYLPNNHRKGPYDHHFVLVSTTTLNETYQTREEAEERCRILNEEEFESEVNLEKEGYYKYIITKG